MAQVLRHLPKFEDKSVIVGLDGSDDAGVYKINDEEAVILTMDFFTPVVDEPYEFGQVAAANALSDIYAMGGRPVTALNVVCFPECLPIDILIDILKGGGDKVKEAGAVIIGGHTVEDDEPKYGLSVMGRVHPDKVITNGGARPGDALILTKPLGLGIINTGIKAGLVEEDTIKRVVEIMSYLNKDACDAMLKMGVKGCTDITGFGLLGHGMEMAKASGVTLEIKSDSLPIIKESVDLAKMGIIPAGAYKNKEFVEEQVRFKNAINKEIEDILYDPQTSGGLLIAVEEKSSKKLLKLLKENNKTEFALIGKVKEKEDYSIIIV